MGPAVANTAKGQFRYSQFDQIFFWLEPPIVFPRKPVPHHRNGPIPNSLEDSQTSNMALVLRSIWLGPFCLETPEPDIAPSQCHHEVATPESQNTRFRSFECVGVGHGIKEAPSMKRFVVRGPWALFIRY